ncbi:hypothetical protein M0804_005009 [Polistes exclamans]|nr:hypothetical protein M0804_005009 [Polistes exclamans]
MGRRERERERVRGKIEYEALKGTRFIGVYRFLFVWKNKAWLGVEKKDIVVTSSTETSLEGGRLLLRMPWPPFMDPDNG